MDIKKIFIWIVILIVNLILNFYILPFIQKSANSHMNEGPIWGFIMFIISIIVFVLGVNAFFSKYDKMFLFYFLSLITLIFWGYKFYTIICLSCLNNG
ncbi:MAG: hypothetical protein RLZZ175_1154 [Bacteroidota bacterium]|jgi:quinol-cytochrome oxidoreductase complex cytochrome b subunit